MQTFRDWMPAIVSAMMIISMVVGVILAIGQLRNDINSLTALEKKNEMRLDQLERDVTDIAVNVSRIEGRLHSANYNMKQPTHIVQQDSYGNYSANE